MTSVGTLLRFTIDSPAAIRRGDILETSTGRRYGVLASTRRGRRYALRCVVIDRDTEPEVVATAARGGIDLYVGQIHRIRWGKRKP